MKVLITSSQVFIDNFEFCKTQVEFAKRFKEESFEDFIEHFDMLWGIDVSDQYDKDCLWVLYQYVKD